MKINCIFKKALIVPLFLYTVLCIGQVGIGNNTPEGALDINGSANGIVYPVVSLVDINSQTITNPNGGGNLVAGTTVYNSATSGVGNASVYPGIYVWDGAVPNPKWVPQFSKRDYKLFEQNADLRPRSNSTAEAISFNSNTFTPKYSGTYKVEIKAHYGGGEVVNAGSSNSNNVNFNAQEGKFSFSFNSQTKLFGIRSYSADNNGQSTKYFNDAAQNIYVTTTSLTRNVPYTFSLSCDQSAAPGFIDDGNNGGGGLGQGYITINGRIKCTVEINYIGD